MTGWADLMRQLLARATVTRRTLDGIQKNLQTLEETIMTTKEDLSAELDRLVTQTGTVRELIEGGLQDVRDLRAQVASLQKQVNQTPPVPVEPVMFDDLMTKVQSAEANLNQAISESAPAPTPPDGSTDTPAPAAPDAGTPDAGTPAPATPDTGNAGDSTPAGPGDSGAGDTSNPPPADNGGLQSPPPPPGE